MASTQTVPDEELLALLAPAAGGAAVREQRSAKADGLFPAGAKGKALAAAARERGLIESCPDPEAPPLRGKGKAPKLTHVRITPSGREQVLLRLNPKARARSSAPPARITPLGVPGATWVDGPHGPGRRLRAAVDRLHAGLGEQSDRRRAEAAEWRQLLAVLEGKV